MDPTAALRLRQAITRTEAATRGRAPSIQCQG